MSGWWSQRYVREPFQLRPRPEPPRTQDVGGLTASLVSDLAGHSRVETTQLCSLPTAADEARVVIVVLDWL